MEISEFEHFRDLLLERRQNLTEWLNSGSSTRVDDVNVVRGLLTQIKDALGQIEDRSYGSCQVCHEGVELHRLEVQPVTRVCLGCISKDELDQLEEDLFLASKIHRALLPQTVPEIEGFEINVRSLAAGNIGGDYYDFLSGADGRTSRIVIADTMGHGLPAGLLMSNLQGALRILSPDYTSPAPFMTRLNKWLCRNVPVTKFVSMVCLNIKNAGKNKTEIIYTNAGHCLPILTRADGSVERLSVTGGVLGVHEAFTYEEEHITLHSGDYLTLYTDGIIEAKNARDEEFDETRLVDFIRDHQSDSFASIADDLIDSVREFCGTSRASDDITAMILRKK